MTFSPSTQFLMGYADLKPEDKLKINSDVLMYGVAFIKTDNDGAPIRVCPESFYNNGEKNDEEKIHIFKRN